MKISHNKVLAVLQLFLGGMLSALCFGILSLILYCLAGGLGAVLIPLVVYFGVRFAEKWRERFRDRHNIGSAVFIAMAELPSVLIGGVLFLLLMTNSKGGDLTDIVSELLGAAVSAFWGGAALLIMLGTAICSVVGRFVRRNK